MFEVYPESEVIGFADDTALFFKDKTWIDLKNKVESELPKIQNWFNHSLLTLNLEKTFYVAFHCNKVTTPPFNELNVKVSNQNISIKSKEHVKYLGVYLDKHLKWNVHINYVCKKLRFVISRFKCLTDILDLNQLKILYHALVESHISYCISIWGSALKTHLRPLEIIQRRFLKNPYCTRPIISFLKQIY